MHLPVLLNEALEGLAIQPDGIYIDGTFGRGGHSRAILEKLGPQGRLIAIDKDPEAIAEAIKHDTRFVIEQGSFARIKEIAQKYGVDKKVNGILLDLGVSSPQLDDPLRGFSFLRNGPLDMRMDPGAGQSAADWIAKATDTAMADVFKTYGEERHARRIAQAIVRERAVAPIETTARLSKIVADANPAWEKGKNPATRVFQAIRIFINQELDDLEQCLKQSVEILAMQGRLAVISFHSLEDRIVKRFMRDGAKGNFPENIPVTQAELNPELRIVGRAIKPALDEIENNPRARSAVLRIVEKRI